MTNPVGAPLRLRNPPIVEAVFDLFCSMPDGFDIEKFEKPASDILRPKYPTVKKIHMLEQAFAYQMGKDPDILAKSTLRGFQFFSPDEKQVVQFRSDGFSFNRLAPYTILDDYLPDITDAWQVFNRLCKPTIVSRISLRNINRIEVKMVDQTVNLENYLRIRPHLPDEKNLTFTAFLNNHQLLEPSTGNMANIILTSQQALDQTLAIILDITAFNIVNTDPDSPAIWEKTLPSIRRLKDEVFKNTLSETCLKSYQPL